MVIYSAFDHPLCKEVLSRIDAIADVDVVMIKPRKNLGNSNVYYPVENEIVNILPDVPALIDDKKIIIGFEILSYLAENPKTNGFLIQNEMSEM